MSKRALHRVAERGDGWLPACVVPSRVDIDGLAHQRSLIDELAKKAGSEPSAVDTILRIDIDAGTSSETVATTIRTVHERTGIDHVMVDTMYCDGTVDQSLQRAE